MQAFLLTLLHFTSLICIVYVHTINDYANSQEHAHHYLMMYFNISKTYLSQRKLNRTKRKLRSCFSKMPLLYVSSRISFNYPTRDATFPCVFFGLRFVRQRTKPVWLAQPSCCCWSVAYSHMQAHENWCCSIEIKMVLMWKMTFSTNYVFDKNLPLEISYLWTGLKKGLFM